MKIYFESKRPEFYVGENKIFNFFNLHNVWWINNDDNYQKIVSNENNVSFPDGKNIARYLNIRQQRGPSFTKRFLISKEAKFKKHFFIGDISVNNLSEKTGISRKNIVSYNPPYIKNLRFPKKEIKIIINRLEQDKFDFVWICVGSPKQEFLANELFKGYKTDYFNIGAALDFLIGKKKEAPAFVRAIGIEWLYRLVTDFKYTRKKVMRSFIALFYLRESVELVR